MKDLSKKSSFILCLNIALGVLLVSIQIFFAFHYKIKYLAISSILTLVYFSINIFNLYKTIKSERIYQDLESEKLFNKSLIMSNDNIRAFKHDFNNIIQCIGGYISTNDMNGLKNYYSQLLDDCQRTSNLSALSPAVINNPAIYSLLASKYYKADKAGIKMNFEIYLDLNALKIKIYELSRILGILLDNAIEASLDCKEKIINVKFKNDIFNNRQLLIIENTYINKDVNLDKIFEKSYSTKPNNTGLGLWEVRQILKKNNNINLFTDKNYRFFKQQLEIYT